MDGYASPLAAVHLLRQKLWDGGFRPVPVYNFDYQAIPPKHRGKRPLGRGWQNDAMADPPICVSAAPNPAALNTGILCSGLRAIDIDVDDEHLARTVQAAAIQRFAGEPLIRYRDNSPRTLLLYRAAVGTPEKEAIGNDVHKVEVLGAGQQFVAFGTHGTGAELRWMPEAPGDVGVSALPAISEDEVFEFLTEAASIIGAPPPRRRASAQGPRVSGEPRADVALIASAMAAIPNRDESWDDWIAYGLRVYAATDGSERGLHVWLDWSLKSKKFTPGACEERWKHFRTSPPTTGGAGSIFREAKANGWTWPKDNPEEEKAARRRETPKPNAGPVIRVVAGELHLNSTAAEDAIIASDLSIFQRGSMLVRPVVQEVPAARGRMTVTAALSEMTSTSLVDALCSCASFEKWDARAKDYVRINPPKNIAETILSRAGMWRLPKVVGVITTPTIRPDGSVLHAPGYDPATRLFHAADPDLTLYPEVHKPTRQTAEKCLALLNGLLADFPFVSDVSRAVALTALMVPVLRGILPVVPLHAFRASTPGTGKSYLADIASTIGTGRRCPVTSAGSDEAELEKRLGGLLLAGFPVASLDNVNGELGGELLCQAIERPFIRLRPLGSSDIVEIESRTTLFATGNGLRVCDDMVRRTVVCDLDAEMERPELRTFSGDPVAKVMANRGRYVSAILIVVRAYLEAGSPEVLSPLASFAEWSDLVRSALVWLGCADPVESMEQAREDDPELALMREVIGLWRSRIGQVALTAREMAERASERNPTVMGEPTDWAEPELRDVLLRVAGERGAIDTNKLSYWLRKRVGRIVDGSRISHGEKAHGGAQRWWLRW